MANVILDFEKPVEILEQKLAEWEHLSTSNNIDAQEELEAFRRKVEDTKKSIYENLTRGRKLACKTSEQALYARLHRTHLHGFHRTPRRQAIRRRSGSRWRLRKTRRNESHGHRHSERPANTKESVHVISAVRIRKDTESHPLMKTRRPRGRAGCDTHRHPGRIPRRGIRRKTYRRSQLL